MRAGTRFRSGRALRALSTLFLAVAAMFLPASLCALPTGSNPVAVMPDCAGMAVDFGDGQDSARHGPPSVCAGCAPQPDAAARFGPAMPWATILPFAEPAGQLIGAASEPPTPPPRADAAKT